jgi:hypothetical protein
MGCEVTVIVDIHIHPFCEEATITPNLAEAVKRMFFEPRSRQVSVEKATSIGENIFRSRKLADIIEDMDEAGDSSWSRRFNTSTSPIRSTIHCGRRRWSWTSWYGPTPRIRGGIPIPTPGWGIRC